MNKRTLNIAGISFLILFLVLVITKFYIDRYKLENENRITVGYVFDVVQLYGRSGYSLYFNYTVNGKKYEKDLTVYKNQNPESLLNKRFFVSFYPPNPNNSQILLNEPVPDQLKEVPLDGWEKIP